MSQPDDPELSRLRDATDAALRARVAAVPRWYHAIELRPGIVTPGAYDLRPHVDAFGFPASLVGQMVVDVGASNGFFSFHFEKLQAARVVAVDLPSVRDHDLPGWYRDQRLEARTADEVQALDRAELEAGFALAHAALGSQVETRRCHVRDLGQLCPGAFDFAFCSNLLHQLRDPVEALESIRASLAPGGHLVLGCPCDLSLDLSYAVFVGSVDPVMWWVMSRRALLRMCRLAGFVDVRWIGSFEFATRTEPDATGTMGVLHATAPEVVPPLEAADPGWGGVPRRAPAPPSR